MTDNGTLHGVTREEIQRGMKPALEIFRQTNDDRPLADYVLSLLNMVVVKALNKREQERREFYGRL